MFDFRNVAKYTTPSVLAELAATASGVEGLVAPDGRADYGEIAARAVSLGDGFRTLGLDVGDRVGLLLPNGLRWCLAALAAHTAGLSVVPINTWSRSSELTEIVQRAGVRAIVSDRVVFDHDFEDELDGLGLLAGSGPFLGASWWPSGAMAPEGFDPVACADPVDRLASTPTTESSEALLLFTSGSTGGPKAVPLDHGGMIRNARAIGDRHHAVPGDRIFFASPLFFVFGCANALPNALTHAATLCLQDRFDATEALQFIETERCTIYYGVSRMTQALAACPALAERDISSLRTGSTALAPGEDLLVTEVLGISGICNAYGLTEGYSHTTMSDAEDPPEVRLHTEGRPLPTQEVRIVGPDGGDAAPGEAGQVRIRGCVTRGYLDAAELNERSFDDDGWFTTGDIGLVDEAGYFNYLGRSDDMFKINGINVSPLEIEQILVGHPDVDEAIAFATAGGGPGDKVLCCVLVEQEGSERRPDVEEVLRWLQGRVASYKIPKRGAVLASADLPVTATGKVTRRLLAETFEASNYGVDDLERPR